MHLNYYSQEISIYFESLQELNSFLLNQIQNVFLRKSSCFVDTKIEYIVGEKYRLLGLKLEDKEISKDSIDTTMDMVDYINLIQNIDKSKLSIENIYFICNVNNIEKLKPDVEIEMI